MIRETSKPVGQRVIKVGVMLGLSLLCTAAALATPSGDPQNSMRVHYSDLDLSRPEGAQKLYRRIEFAARLVCDSYASNELERRKVYLKCYSKAVNEAVRKVGSDKLTAIHLGHTRLISTG
jgi:UrcA family protein